MSRAWIGQRAGRDCPAGSGRRALPVSTPAVEPRVGLAPLVASRFGATYRRRFGIGTLGAFGGVFGVVRSHDRLRPRQCPVRVGCQDVVGNAGSGHLGMIVFGADDDLILLMVVLNERDQLGLLR